MKAGAQPQPNSVLQKLGFEEEELEMFFELMEHVDQQQLIDRYLEIARQEPYNIYWNTIDDAINANYMLNKFKRNGVEITKNDIANDTLNSFYHGGKHKNKRKKGKSRKNRKSKRKNNKSRRHLRK